MPAAAHWQVATEAFEADIYRSYTSDDVQLFREFVDIAAQPVPDAYVDFLGRITRSRFIYTCAPWNGLVSQDLPVPGDGFYADAIEYTGLLSAIRTVENNRLVVAELGAGWGPWMAAAGVAARFKGVAQVDLVGIEGSEGKIAHLKEHLADNGLRPGTSEDWTQYRGVRCRCIRGIIWAEAGTAQFPMFDPATQFGAAATTGIVAGRGVDYRGRTFAYEDVAAYRIQDILNEYPVVDFIHIDIQGAELDVCRAAIDFLAERARFIFVGTHSRTIEGELLKLFFPAGFTLLREKPCRLVCDGWTGVLEALTLADGGQLWRNSRFDRTDRAGDCG